MQTLLRYCVGVNVSKDTLNPRTTRSMLRGYRGYRVWVWNSKLTRWQPLSKNIYARAYEADYVAKLAELAKKIVPTGGTTQDQEAEAVLSCV